MSESFTIFFVRISSFLGDPARLFGLFGLFTPTDDAEGGAVGVENGNEAPDDVEAPAGSSGIALANMATNQTPVAGAPPRGAEGQSEMPSQSKGLARANNSSNALLPRPPAGLKITLGDHQIGKVPTRDQVHLPAFAVHTYTFSFSVVSDLNIITLCPSTDYPLPP